jgi:hypothetical protein
MICIAVKVCNEFLFCAFASLRENSLVEIRVIRGEKNSMPSPRPWHTKHGVHGV